MWLVNLGYISLGRIYWFSRFEGMIEEIGVSQCSVNGSYSRSARSGISITKTLKRIMFFVRMCLENLDGA